MEEDKEDTKEFLPGYKSVQAFSTDGFKRVVNGVKAFQALPQPGPSWDLHKSYPEFSRSMKQARSKIVPMMASLLKHVNIPTSDFRSRDVDEKFEFLVECNDDLLERIGSSLDEAEGLFTKSEMVVVDKGLAATSLKAPGSWGKRKLNAMEEEATESKTKPQDISSRQIKRAAFRLRVTEKPQLKFTQPIDNSPAPFVPKLKEKPHSVKPLSILPEYNSKNEEFFGHPYLVELNKWVPRDDMLTKVNPQTPKPLKDTPVVFVSNARDLERMMYDLLNKTEIAVDLEHHSYRTYLGLTCLIQISSREKDYVIDSLALRDELSHLNEILADPKVLKVFHGSNNDIDWLQRDFGLYVVNMFDTYLAAKALGLPQFSLQYLLGKYCEISQNKSMQLADWRIRPLPNEMVEYARQDTHFLIYIYELMRNELIDAGNQHNNLLLSVYDQSRLLCLKRYEKPISNAQLALRKTRRSLNNRQLYAFTEIYKWRDEIARDKDESLGFVLPNHMLLTIAEALPKEMNGILACCDPVPPLLTANLGKIHKIITTARELPLHQQSTQKDKVEKKTKLKNWVVVVNSIHDLAPVDPSDSTNLINCENDEILPKKPVENTSWPQPWIDPGGWTNLTKSKPSSWKFGRRLAAKINRTHHLSETPTSVVLDPERLTTPYGRYEASKKILDMLKDPKKQENLNLDDPLVKAVYDAVQVVDESEKVSEETEDAPLQKLSKVLDEGEFIPFNPLAQSTTPKTKRRRRNNSREPVDIKSENSQSNNCEVDALGIGVLGQGESDEESARPDSVAPTSKSSPLLKTSKNKRNRRKTGKGKLMNRLKNIFSKNKSSETTNDNNVEVIDIDEGEIVESEPLVQKSNSHDQRQSQSQHHPSIPSPPSKRSRRGNYNNHSSQQERYQNFTDDRRGHGLTPNQKRDFKKSDRHKNKAGIFKAFKRDNKSITFK